MFFKPNILRLQYLKVLLYIFVMVKKSLNQKKINLVQATNSLFYLRTHLISMFHKQEHTVRPWKDDFYMKVTLVFKKNATNASSDNKARLPQKNKQH